MQISPKDRRKKTLISSKDRGKKRKIRQRIVVKNANFIKFHGKKVQISTKNRDRKVGITIVGKIFFSFTNVKKTLRNEKKL